SIPIPGKGAVGIYDHSFLGNAHIGAHVEANTGPGYIADGNWSTFIGCYSESAMPNIIKGNNIIVGGDHYAGFSEDSDATRLVPYNMHGIVDQNLVRTLQPHTQMLYPQDPPFSVFVWSTRDDGGISNSYFGWRYGILGIPPGWWTLGYGIQQAANHFI